MRLRRIGAIPNTGYGKDVMDGKSGGAVMIGPSEYSLLIDTMEGYTRHLTGGNLSPETVMAYGTGVMRYLGWHWQSRGAYPDMLRRKSVLDFKTYLLIVARSAPDAVNLCISALSDYNGYLIYINHQVEVAVRAPDRVGNATERYGAPETAEVESFRRRVLEKSGARDYAVVTVMAYAGLGRGEAANLKTEDISFDDMKIVVRENAGGGFRTVRMNEKIAEALCDHLSVKKPTGPYVFPGRRKEKISEDAIGRIFGKFPGDITPRSLKRFFRSYEASTASCFRFGLWHST
jgi:integrase